MKQREKKEVEEDGYRFDSKKEWFFYKELKLRKKAKEFIDFDVHPKFVLQEGFYHQGQKVQAITYTADFRIFYEGKTEIVDVKGVQTETFKIKWKMLKNKFREDVYLFTIV